MSRATLTLIQRQDATLARLHEPRSSERRAQRMRSRVLGHYRVKALALGYAQEQVDGQVRDLLDMWSLECSAEADAD